VDRRPRFNARLVIGGIGSRATLRPRGRPFKKGERHSFQFQPGQSGNPGGKPKIHQRISAEYSALLLDIVPPEIAASVGVAKGSTWAEAIALAIAIRAACGDVNAARELAERTEGRVPTAVSVEGTIDYAAGRSAKEQLLKKLNCEP